MNRKITRQKTVTVEDNVICCDICEQQITDGGFIVVSAAVPRAGGCKFVQNKSMDICLECLSKNSKAIRLLLDTKVLPELQNSLDSQDDNTDSLTDMLNDFEVKKMYKDVMYKDVKAMKWHNTKSEI